MKDKVEAILFAAGRYLEADYIAKLLQTDLRTTKKALSELKEDYTTREGSAITLVQEENRWKLQVKDAYLEYASKLAGDTEIAKTVLETLAVVAWKNGISQAELIKIRGPAAYEHIGELVQRGFLTKAPEGRSFKLTLQQKFFDYFDVEGRESMKTLFAPVEAEKAAAQAEIDAKQAEYDARTRAAQEAVGSLSVKDSGSPMPVQPSAQMVANPPQSRPVDLAAEAKATVDAHTAVNAQEVSGAVKAFGESLEALKTKDAHEHRKRSKQSSATVIVAEKADQDTHPTASEKID
jgi:segregation and condensation protein B